MKSHAWFFGVFAALVILVNDNASAEGVGVFGLYHVEGNQLAVGLGGLQEDFRRRGCSIHREGEIQDVQGPLKLRPANRFFLLECGRSLLKDVSSRSVLLPLEQKVGPLTLFEGEMEAFPGLSSPGQEREYVFKISYYTNVDPDRRDRDLADLQANAMMRADRYQNEALIVPSRAFGSTTPDEVAILYYESPTQASKFREANGDILKAIGQFNKDHLGSFAYLGGASKR